MSAPDQPFLAPWQAQVFGLTVALSQAGLFGWSDWTQALGARLAAGADYWDGWLQALEGILTAQGIALPDDIAVLAQRWQAAAHATPHGHPIVLENTPGDYVQDCS